MIKFFTKPYGSVLSMAAWGITLSLTDLWWPPVLVLILATFISDLLYELATRQTFEEFCREWLDWAMSGGPAHPRFRRDRGLCASVPKHLRKELEMRLLDSTGSTMAPFGNYSRDTHLNRARLAWVKEQLKCPG